MSATTKERYARRKRSEANRISQQRATAWSDTDDGQMSDDQLDGQPSDADSQVSGPVSVTSDRRLEDQPDGRPVTPAAPAATAIPMEALLAITQALKLSSSAPRSEIRPPTFNGEGDLTLFLKQFEDVADANGWTRVQRTLHLRSQLAGEAQGCGHGDSYQEIVDDLHARFGVSRRQARDRLAVLKMRASQSIHSQAAEVSRMVKVAFPTLADADQRAMALEYFTRAWESKSIQRHLLAVAPVTMKEAVQAMEEYLAVSGPDQTPRAMPVDQSEVPSQPSVLEASLKAMAEAVTQQTLLLQQVLEKVGQKAARQQKGCFKCGGPHMQRDCPQNNKQPSTAAKTTAAGNGEGPAQA